MTDNNGGPLALTPEEIEAGLAELTEKYITSRTPETFRERLLKLEPNVIKAAAMIETDPQALRRWINGRSKIPGVAWVALGLIERIDNE